MHWKSCARHPVDGRPFLHRIHCQTLVLCGREDVLTPVELHEELAVGIANSNLVVIDQCGDMSALEQPQQFAEAMQACLSAVRI